MDKELSMGQKRDNCLNLIRIIAAFQVMFGHMVEHLELPINNYFFSATYFFRGVPIFFVISGFLIWFSMQRSKNYGNYLKKRFWRIYPELWVAVIIEIIVLIVVYHRWSMKELLLFAFCQATLFQFWTPDSLRGYGVGTPNGALWTIGVMIQFYIISWVFYKLMQNRKMVVWGIGLLLSFVISWLGNYITHTMIGVGIIGKLYDQTFIKYFWLFFIGMFIAKFQNTILPVLKKNWWILLIVALPFFFTKFDLYSGYYLFWSLFMTSGLIGFAYRFPKLSVNPDISYGLFLYHMTVINVFVSFNCLQNWMIIVPVVIITGIVSYLSTVTIGRLSANKKNKSSN